MPSSSSRLLGWVVWLCKPPTVLLPGVTESGDPLCAWAQAGITPRVSMGGSSSSEEFGLTEKELKTLRENFHRLDKDSSGGLNEEEFREFLGGIGLDVELSAILFEQFDKDGDGSVSLPEFLGTISLMVHGSLEERLSFSFGLYDLNGNNVIKRDEVRSMLQAMYRAQASMCPATTQELTPEQLEVQSQAFFDALDTDKNGSISREEYVQGAMTHPELFRSLGYYTPAPDEIKPEDDVALGRRLFTQMVDAASDLFSSRTTIGERIYIGHPALNVVLMVMSTICTVLQPTLPSTKQEKAATSAVSGSPPEGQNDPSQGGRNWDSKSQPLDPAAFKEELEWELPGLNNQKVRVIEHRPKVFQRIRSLLRVDVRELLEAMGIKQLLGNMLMGDCTTLRAGLSEAKSGSFFFESHDSKYVLKTIGEDESDMLLEHLGSYWQHLEASPVTLLSHFFGLYDIFGTGADGSQPLRMRLILMNNVLYHPKLVQQVNERYDLKGAKFLRATGKAPGGGNLLLDKDLDELGTRLKLGNVRDGFLKQLNLDSQWLASCGLYDYSLLVGIIRLANPTPPDCQVVDDVGTYRVIVAPDGSACYLLGVIDVLTEFSFSRRVQQTLQTVITFGLTEVSACPPDEYAERLQRYVESIVD